MRNVRRLTVITLSVASACVDSTTLQAQDATPTAAQEITVQSTSSQDDAALPSQWDLQTCIDYALQHNITLKRNRISAESAEVDVKTAKAALFPSLSATARRIRLSMVTTSPVAPVRRRTTVAMVLMPVGPSTMAASA